MGNSYIQPLFPIPLGIFDLSQEIVPKEMQALCDYAENGNNMRLNIYKNLSSSDTYIFKDNCGLSLRSTIEKYVKHYAHEVLCYHNNVNFYITQSWLNINPKYTSHHRHKHPNSIISGVFYVKTEHNSGNIIFWKDNPKTGGLELSLHEKLNEFSWTKFSLNPQQYCLILFPSSLEHSVDENMGIKNRISISFNTFVKGIVSVDPEVTTLTTLLLS